MFTFVFTKTKRCLFPAWYPSLCLGYHAGLKQPLLMLFKIRCLNWSKDHLKSANTIWVLFCVVESNTMLFNKAKYCFNKWHWRCLRHCATRARNKAHAKNCARSIRSPVMPPKSTQRAKRPITSPKVWCTKQLLWPWVLLSIFFVATSKSQKT